MEIWLFINGIFTIGVISIMLGTALAWRAHAAEKRRRARDHQTTDQRLAFLRPIERHDRAQGDRMTDELSEQALRG
jgi:hypothetical protein